MEYKGRGMRRNYREGGPNGEVTVQLHSTHRSVCNKSHTHTHTAVTDDNGNNNNTNNQLANNKNDKIN